MRALSEQHGVIDSFRTRAGLLLSSAAVTTSFLAAQALRHGGTSTLAWLALLTFAGTAALSLAILWPRRWDFSARSGEPIDSCAETGEQVSVSEIYWSLSSHLEQSYRANRDALEHLAILLQIASSLLAVEAISWTAAIAAGP